jgi:hypothetical protein
MSRCDARAIFRLLLLSIAAGVFAERDACAYTDPGSGALLWQMMLAALFGSMFYVRRFINWFNSRKGKTAIRNPQSEIRNNDDSLAP